MHKKSGEARLAGPCLYANEKEQRLQLAHFGIETHDLKEESYVYFGRRTAFYWMESGSFESTKQWRFYDTADNKSSNSL